MMPASATWFTTTGRLGDSAIDNYCRTAPLKLLQHRIVLQYCYMSIESFILTGGLTKVTVKSTKSRGFIPGIFQQDVIHAL
ncbi:hypothetical protein ANAEL_00501 [Anaerolineales bacterium]|nr:hypothetical protein ANAEL_00501 [Anaerolineales bacterium]